MSDCRRKYSVLGIADIPCALPCDAQEFVRFLTDINFFGGNVDPWKGLWGDWGFRGVAALPEVRAGNALGGGAFDHVGCHRRKIPFGNSVS